MSLLILPALPLVALFMAILTSLVAPGPILFRQERVGRHGRRFTCLKFRTMRADANPAGHREYLQHLMSSGTPMKKLDEKGDSRMIPGAWWLRATGLDELPQLINVLRGEMSIVGPRPCLPYEYESYLPWQKNRLAALPGLTGLWQVKGKNRTTFEEMVRMDIEYARTVSPLLDAGIMLKTIPALVVQVRQTRQSRKAGTTGSPNGQVLPARNMVERRS